MSETRTAFGQVLRRLRSAASLSQEALAERAGLSKRGISDLERGARQAPRLETVRLLADALKLSDAERQALLAAARPGLLRSEGAGPAASAPVSLPTPLTRLIGREVEVRVLESTLRRDDVRLVTLTGVGGTGKTRLAIAVAGELRDAFPDGIYFIDLAPLTDSDLVLPTIAATLGVRESDGLALRAALAEFLDDSRLLLVCDNYEHLLAAATVVSDLLRVAPKVKALVTSRESLRLHGEWEVAVAPLGLPEAEQRPTVIELERVPAVALFVQQATAARADFVLTPENAAAISEIVRRLDGLPLAIELAAAWVKILTPEGLLARLERRLPLLSGGPRDAPARHRTLRDTIAWSHDLLAPAEQVLLRRLSVFVGGWTLAAVAAVDSGEANDPLHSLSALIAQSLVSERSQAAGIAREPRYGMLETIREFASEQLAASGEADRVRQAFDAYLITLATQAQTGLRGPEQMHWLDRLETEHDNIRAALASALERGDGDFALALASRLWTFWWTRGYPGEGRSWLQRALEMASDSDPAARATAEEGLGRNSISLGDYEAASRHLRASLALRQILGDAAGQAAALNELALIAVNKGELVEASKLGEEALRLASAAGDLRGIGTAWRNLGMVAREQGDYPRAIRLYGESLALWRRLDDPRWIAIVASSLGITHRYEGNAEQAHPVLDESQDLFTRLGDRYMLGVVAHNKGHLAYAAEAFDEAITLYADALQHFESVGVAEGAIESIEWLAVAIAAKGHAAPALRLFGAAEAARETLSLPPPTAADGQLIVSGQKLAYQIASDGQTHLEEGRTLSLEQARDEALVLADAVATAKR